MTSAVASAGTSCARSTSQAATISLIIFVAALNLISSLSMLIMFRVARTERDLANGLCIGCQNAPKECTCEEEPEEE